MITGFFCGNCLKIFVMRPRANLSAVVNGHTGISPELAVKLSEAFGNSTQFWVNLQNNYELWHAEQKIDRNRIRRFHQASA